MSTAEQSPPKTKSNHEQKEWLEDRYNGFFAKEVAFTRAGEAFARSGRRLGLAVVILTTSVGTAAFTSLQGNPSLAAKVVFIVLSVAAAVFAAMKEFLAYAARADEFKAVAKSFESLRYEAKDLALSVDGGESHDEIRAATKALDDKACKLKEPALPDGYYEWAEQYVEAKKLHRPTPDTGSGLRRLFRRSEKITSQSVPATNGSQSANPQSTEKYLPR